MPEYSLMDLFAELKRAELPVYGEEPKLGELTPDEVAAINERLAQIAENEEVFSALWEAREAVYEAVRAVKKWTKTDFKGALAEGDELDLDIIMPDDTEKTGSQRTVWEYSVSTAGTEYFWSGSGDEKVTLDEDEAILIVGWYDPVDSPKASRVMFELPKRNFYVNLPFDMAKDVPLIIHKPEIIKPKEKFAIQVRYNAAGTDALRPVGVYIRKAADRTL